MLFARVIGIVQNFKKEILMFVYQNIKRMCRGKHLGVLDAVALSELLHHAVDLLRLAVHYFDQSVDGGGKLLKLCWSCKTIKS